MPVGPWQPLVLGLFVWGAALFIAVQLAILAWYYRNIRRKFAHVTDQRTFNVFEAVLFAGAATYFLGQVGLLFADDPFALITVPLGLLNPVSVWTVGIMAVPVGIGLMMVAVIALHVAHPPEGPLWWTFKHQTRLGHVLVVLAGLGVWIGMYVVWLEVVGGSFELAAATGAEARAARRGGMRAASVACWLWFSGAFVVGKGGPFLDIGVYPAGALVLGPYLTALAAFGRLPHEMFTAASPVSLRFIDLGIGLFVPGFLLSLVVVFGFLGIVTYVTGTHYDWAAKHAREEWLPGSDFEHGEMPIVENPMPPRVRRLTLGLIVVTVGGLVMGFGDMPVRDGSLIAWLGYPEYQGTVFAIGVVGALTMAYLGYRYNG